MARQDISTGTWLSQRTLLNQNFSEIYATYISESSLGDSFIWNAGILDASGTGGAAGTSKAYVDGSIAALNSSIGAAGFIKSSALTPYATNASIGTAAFAKTSDLNSYASIAYVDTSISKFATNASIATAAFAKNASLSLYATNVSLTFYATNASIGTADFAKTSDLTSYALVTYVNSSLNSRDTQINLRLKEASLGSSFLWTNGVIDVSVAGGGVTQSYVDIADNIIRATYIKSSSTGIGLYWNSGVIDVSVISGMSKSYVDGSIAALNSSIGLAGFIKITALAPYATNSSIGIALLSYATNTSINTAGFSKYTYVDGSLNNIKATYIPNASLGSGFEWSGASLTVNVSTAGGTSYAYVDSSLLARDASIDILFSKSATQEASLNTALSISSYVNTSTYYDGSLNNIRATYIRSASTGSGLYWVGGV
jgi:hypothetical protein